MTARVLRIRTPEGVVFSQTLAGPVVRFSAWFLDLMAISGIMGIIGSLIGLLGLLNRDLAGAVYLVIYFVVSIGYGLAFEWLWRGQTPGKKFLRLRVVDAEGLKLQFHQIVVRNLLRFVDSLPVLYLVGGLACWCSRKFQRLGDIAANTIVVRIPVVAEPEIDQLIAGRFNSLSRYPHLEARLRQQVDQADAALALQALLRRDDFEPSARIEVFSELAAYFRSKVTFPAEAPGLRFARRLFDFRADPTAEQGNDRLRGRYAFPAQAGGMSGGAEFCAPVGNAFGMHGAHVFHAQAQALARFGVEKIEVPGFGKFGFDGIQNLQRKDVVALRAKLRELGEEDVLLVEKIRNQDDKTALAAKRACFVHCEAQVAAALRGIRGERAAEAHGMPRASAWRKPFEQAVPEKSQCGRIALAGGEVRESGGDARGVAVFWRRAVSDIHRAGDIDEQINGAQRFLPAFAGEKLSVARVERPVDAPQIVAVEVGAVAVELDARATPHASVTTEPYCFRETAAGQFEIFHGEEDLRIEQLRKRDLWCFRRVGGGHAVASAFT
jgi:uncharacterized RDD family membrane protein YckC